MWKIEITWKQLYEDIYVKFTKNESDQKTFIKEKMDYTELLM